MALPPSLEGGPLSKEGWISGGMFKERYGSVGNLVWMAELLN